MAAHCCECWPASQPARHNHLVMTTLIITGSPDTAGMAALHAASGLQVELSRMRLVTYCLPSES